MIIIDWSFPTAEENLACDEALLDLCEVGGSPEILRFWEPHQHFVVLGFSNRHREEANLSACRELGVPILRRCSGGGTVLQGPGCLNFALLLKIETPGPLDNIAATNRFILNRHRQLLQQLLGSPISLQGATDLTLDDLKFSGNSQRRRRHWLLFHGTFLLNLKLALLEELLPLPRRQPAYRKGRPHHRFVTNLPLGATRLKDALGQLWNAAEPCPTIPIDRIQELVATRYSKQEWNFRY